MVSALRVQNSFPYGRQPELAAIRSLLDTAETGFGSALVFAGAPGEGRTTLLHAAARLAVGRPAVDRPHADRATGEAVGRLQAHRVTGEAVGRHFADAVVDEAARRSAAAPGWTVLETAGHADETELRLAGLQRLIEPLTPYAADLPAHQREPLTMVVAGAEPGCGPLTLGVAVLALLRSAARRGPVLGLIDDADRLDPASWQQIKLVAHRLAGLPVVLLVTARRAVPDLPSRLLAPLDDSAGHELLADRAPGLAAEVAATLVDLAEGHPGALTDLAAALTPEQRRGFAPPPAALPPSSALRLHARALLEEFPEPTRQLLLLAAAEPSVTPAELLAATSCGPLRTLADLEPAERAGIVEVSGTGVRFTPAVLRSVIYGEAPIGHRHAAHRALAATLTRRLPALLHRAARESGPDDELAHELLEAATCAPAAEAYVARRRAAELSSDPSGEAAALLEAARSALAAGRPRDATPLLRRAGGATGNAVVRSRARALIAGLHARGAPAESRDTLLDVAGALMTSDPAGALDALVVAGEACGRTGNAGRFPALARQAAARSRDDSPADAMAKHQVLGLADLMTGADESGFGHLREVLRLAGRTSEAQPLIRAANAAILLGDDHRAARLATRAVTSARESGNAPLVPEALEVAAYAELAAGRHDAALENALDGVAVARSAGRPDLADAHEALLGLLAAFRGDAPTSRSLTASRGDVGTGRSLAAFRDDAGTGLQGDAGSSRSLASFWGDAGSSRSLASYWGGAGTSCSLGALRGDAGSGWKSSPAGELGEWSEALLDLVAGEPAKAADRLIRIARTGSMTLRVAITPHLVEATGAGGDVFDRWAARTAQPGWLALRSRCRALTTPEGADDYFREALAWHDRDAQNDFARAHTELLYGRHLRRRRRPAEARDHLRRAVETFHRFDAAPWADQAARELRAAGERIVPSGRASSTAPLTAPLTAQQERIAGLVAEGATNREVARQLHLSPRTIDHHLRNVFARLGVRSRTELARLLAAG
ncbi:AAA family ATPase [Actinoplanes sp. LDG1-06]|uniref:AAA family ATPase n=1 Tax=Paractinoplanes ovalisporus TaxID=2810368 RepID=A0ABS2AKK1_9ACTN|nr:LuxR family transcriptional regulator [Actinoplanes ovalisporus]MBM2619776.1 AAA family ATPase [Actinoplanes ovalisporus]